MNTYGTAKFDDLVEVKLDGPPPPGFDCGRTDQNWFLYEHAWPDQASSLSTTYAFYLDGAFAAYATVLMDSLLLDKKERGDIRFRNISALKLGQLAVDREFQGIGIGREAIGTVVDLAREVGERVACRYVSLDAQPNLVTWYEHLGFQVNQARQAERIADAVRHRRDPDGIAVSMRFDLRDPRLVRPTDYASGGLHDAG